jgi:hypothetical protein
MGYLGINLGTTNSAAIIYISFFIFIFVACGKNENNELNFRSMRDVELDVIISLGDSRERVEELLGEGEPGVELRNGEMLDFENGMSVRFNDDVVVGLHAFNEYDAGRFEIFGYTIGMTEEQLAEIFIHPVTSVHHMVGQIHYLNVFDENGRHLDEIQWDDTWVSNMVTMWDTEIYNEINYTQLSVRLH